MIKFPLKFEVRASGPKGISTLWRSQAEQLPPIECAIPAEFQGPGGGYAPEDLLALSLLGCLIATFKVYSEKSKVSFEEIKARAVLTVDRHPSENSLNITEIDIFMDVTGSSDAEKARSLLDKSIKDCMISNVIKAGKTFHLNVS